MKLLVACEKSQVVAKAFRAKGHEAFSCDLQPCSGGRPEWHLQCDVREVLNEWWDCIIAHPECTYITNSGVWCLNRDTGRWKKCYEACQFFKLFINHKKCPRLGVENPIPHKYAADWIGIKYSQIIQPWQFGHPESKATCLWLRGLPKLVPTNVLSLPKSGRWENQTKSGQNRLPPSADRAYLRSRTYEGIAKAMAEQWGNGKIL